MILNSDISEKPESSVPIVATFIVSALAITLILQLWPEFGWGYVGCAIGISLGATGTCYQGKRELVFGSAFGGGVGTVVAMMLLMLFLDPRQSNSYVPISFSVFALIAFVGSVIGFVFGIFFALYDALNGWHKFDWFAKRVDQITFYAMTGMLIFAMLVKANS